MGIIRNESCGQTWITSIKGDGDLVWSNYHFQVIRRAVSTSKLSFKIVEAMHSCFILVQSRQRCISVARANGCDSNLSGIALAQLILNGSSNIDTTWYSSHIRHWIWEATNLWTRHMKDSLVRTNSFVGSEDRTWLCCLIICPAIFGPDTSRALFHYWPEPNVSVT